MTMIRVVDVETSGTEPSDGAQVCELGWCDLHLEENHIGNWQNTMYGVKSMPPEVRAIHHISLDDVSSLPEFGGDISGVGVDAFAAHNAAFEARFIWFTQPLICTYKSALRVWPNAPGHSNGVLRYWLQDQGIIAPDHELTMPPHRAGPDAYVTAHILSALFHAGATGKDMVRWTREPPVFPTCPIGKEWRGKPWAEVDAGFLGWMLRQADMDEDLKFNARREIERRQGENA